MDNMDLAQDTQHESPAAVRLKIIEVLRDLSANITKRTYALYRGLNKNVQKGGIVFAGDSITEGYPLYELFPPNLPIFNRGVNGIASEMLLENLDAQVLDLEPSKLFLLIGTNDLGGNVALEKTADNIRLICEKTQANHPETEVYLISVLPIVPSDVGEVTLLGINARTNESVLKLNELIREISHSADKITYLDVHSVLKGADGEIVPKYTTDGIHLTLEGYRHVTEFLLPNVL